MGTIPDTVATVVTPSRAQFLESHDRLGILREAFGSRGSMRQAAICGGSRSASQTATVTKRDSGIHRWWREMASSPSPA